MYGGEGGAGIKFEQQANTATAESKSARITTLDQLIEACYCIPCLCHIDGRVPGSDKRDHWQQGLAIVDYEVDGRNYSVTYVPIENGQLVWNGQLFTARDRLPEIQRAYPGWNWAE
jgi:hypothetical protein